MRFDKRIVIPLALVFLFIVGSAVFFQALGRRPAAPAPPPTQPSPESSLPQPAPQRSPLLPPTELPQRQPGRAIVAGRSTVVAGAYMSWATNAQAIPPTRLPDDPLGPGNQILGVDCLTYLGSGGDVGAGTVWDNEKAINWGWFDLCLRNSAQQTITLSSGAVISQPVVLSIPSLYMSDGARFYQSGNHGAPGSSTNPFVRLHLPPWMQNEKYRFTFQTPGGKWYQSLTYNGAFKDKMKQFIQEAGARYNGNPQVSVVKVAAGYSGESFPIAKCQPYWPGNPDCGTDTDVQVAQAHEKIVSCDEFTAFIRELNETAYQAFPDKPVVAIVGVSPCTTESGQRLRRDLYQYIWRPAGKNIGASINSLFEDRADAAEADGNAYAGWGQMSTMQTLSAWGMPTYYEWGSNPLLGGRDLYQSLYWTFAAGAGTGGDFIAWPPGWRDYYNRDRKSVV
jgi:hypothetical protein